MASVPEPGNSDEGLPENSEFFETCLKDFFRLT